MLPKFYSFGKHKQFQNLESQNTMHTFLSTEKNAQWPSHQTWRHGNTCGWRIWIHWGYILQETSIHPPHKIFKKQIQTSSTTSANGRPHRMESWQINIPWTIQITHLLKTRLCHFYPQISKEILPQTVWPYTLRRLKTGFRSFQNFFGWYTLRPMKHPYNSDANNWLSNTTHNSSLVHQTQLMTASSTLNTKIRKNQ